LGAAEGGPHDRTSGRLHFEAHVDKIELQKVERYFRRTFNNANMRVVARPKKKDSAEVYVGEEFIGILFLDDEDGDRSYSFTMSILDTDLE
jgi:hypothetical protein